MKSKSIVLILSGFVAGCALSFFVFSPLRPPQEPRYHRPGEYSRRHPEDMRAGADSERIKELRQYRERMHDGLELTETQKKMMREKFRTDRKDTVKLSGELSEKLESLREELASEQIDRDIVETLVEDIAVLQKKMLHRRIRGIYGFRETLTDEQWDKVKERGMMRMLGPERFK